MAQRRSLLSSPPRWTVWSGHSLRQAQGRLCPLPLTLTLFEARQAEICLDPSWKSGASAVQFDDILYKTFRDILYTRPASAAGGVAIVECGCMGSNSQVKVRR
jgi:hypothetical protein